MSDHSSAFLAQVDHAEAVSVTRNLLFAQGSATADGVPCLRANGIFKITSPGSTKSGDLSGDTLFGVKS